MRTTLILLAALMASPCPAAVLCQRKSGAIFAREACKKKETTVDLTQFGVLGSGTTFDDRYFTKTEADDRYHTKTEADDRYFTKTESDDRYFSQSDASKLEIPPPIRTIFTTGEATTLAPHECAAVFIFGVGADIDANSVVAFHIVDVNGDRVPSLNNATVFLPGTVFKTSQGGTIGFGEVCNPTSSPKDLPQGWKTVVRVL
jgi:hypothetical protein